MSNKRVKRIKQWSQRMVAQGRSMFQVNRDEKIVGVLAVALVIMVVLIVARVAWGFWCQK